MTALTTTAPATTPAPTALYRGRRGFIITEYPDGTCIFEPIGGHPVHVKTHECLRCSTRQTPWGETVWVPQYDQVDAQDRKEFLRQALIALAAAREFISAIPACSLARSYATKAHNTLLGEIARAELDGLDEQQPSL